MDWQGEGILLSVRRFGEANAIIEVFTPDHGRHAGVVRGGGSRKMAASLQPGNQLAVEWRARLSEHIGSFRIEVLRSRMAPVMSDPVALAGLGAVIAMIRFGLPEREAHPRLYALTEALFDHLGAENWPAAYALWEASLLSDLGFGLDLSQCAATGTRQELHYVSPKSGRAVSRSAGAEWADRMLPLPGFLRLEDAGAADRADTLAALKTTGFFLEKRLAAALGKAAPPEARSRFLDVLKR
jgi:DNA repair protein RecO (recombination protein O)